MRECVIPHLCWLTLHYEEEKSENDEKKRDGDTRLLLLLSFLDAVRMPTRMAVMAAARRSPKRSDKIRQGRENEQQLHFYLRLFLALFR